MATARSALEEQIALIRAIGYGGTAIGALAAGFSVAAAAVALWCLVLPTTLARAVRPVLPPRQASASRWRVDIARLFARLARPRPLHLVEALLTPAILASTGVWGALQLAAVLMLAIGATARAGLAFGCRTLGCALVGAGVGAWLSPDAGGHPAAPAWLGAYGCVLVAAYALVLADVAFRQTGRQVGERRAAVAVATRLGRYLPEPVLDQSGRTPGAVTREWLTVAFVDLVGFTRLTEHLAAEELKPLLDGFLDVAARTARRHDGFVAKVAGDGAMLVFGGEDRERAARSALACCRELRRALGVASQHLIRIGTPARLAARVAAASGFCSVGDWGRGERLEFTVIGRPANLASRLQALAEPGETLVCERTALLLGECATAKRHAELAGLGDVAYWAIADPFPGPAQAPGFTAPRP